MAKKSKPTVVCGTCKSTFVPEIETERRDDLEITFLQCPSCLERTVVSVTDTPLRESIDEFLRLAKAIQTAEAGQEKEKLTQKALRLKKSNLRRARELKAQEVI